ncbi:MAG: hypothetical protein AB1634_09650 [Thermodesulfobacteriota bacterium]
MAAETDLKARCLERLAGISLDEIHRKHIAEILTELDCPKAFRCVEQGFVQLCRAVDVGRATYLACFEPLPAACRFALDLGGEHYCRCPLRVYLMKHLQR